MKLIGLSLLLCCITLCLAELVWEVRDYGIEIAPKCDFLDNDIEDNNPELELSDEMDCARACKNTMGCTHFTFNGVECWKKSGSVSKDNAFDADFEGVFCGIVTKDKTSGINTRSWKSQGDNEIKWTDKDDVVWGKNCAFLNEEATKIPTSSQNQCYMKCKSKTSCNHFTWFNGMCFLQSKPITVSDASFKEGSVCGVIKGTKAGLKWQRSSSGLGTRAGLDLGWQRFGFSFADECDFFDRDMPGESAESVQKCALVCRNTLGCTHFAWLNNFCVKKSGIVTKKDAIDQPGVKCGLLDEQFTPELKWKRVEPQLEIAEFCDFSHASDLKMVNANNAAECANLCKDNIDCTHFVVNVLFKDCSLKGGKISKNDAIFWGPNAFCGILNQF